MLDGIHFQRHVGIDGNLPTLAAQQTQNKLYEKTLRVSVTVRYGYWRPFSKPGTGFQLRSRHTLFRLDRILNQLRNTALRFRLWHLQRLLPSTHRLLVRMVWWHPAIGDRENNTNSHHSHCTQCHLAVLP